MSDYGTIVRILCGQDQFDIVKNKSARCLFNGCEILNTKVSDLSEQAIPLTGMLVLSACTCPQMPVKVKHAPSYTQDIKELLDTLSKSDQVKLEVIEEKPDEMTDNTSTPAIFTAKDLSEYRHKLREYVACQEQARSIATILLKTKLPRNMWGFKDIDQALSKIKNSYQNVSASASEQFDMIAEQSDIRAGQILQLPRSGISGSERKRIATEAIDQISTNFETIKKMISDFVLAFYQLYRINGMIKKVTGYPATWFFDPSAFYLFQERFEDMSDNLIDAARVETSLIRPLRAWMQKAR